MRRVAWLGVAADVDADAGTGVVDAGPCDPSQPFGALVPLDGVQDDPNSDGNTIYCSQNMPRADGGFTTALLSLRKDVAGDSVISLVEEGQSILGVAVPPSHHTRGGALTDFDSADIYVATRDRATDAFSAPVVVPGLSTADHFESADFLSVNGCRLYMTSNRTGGLHEYVATRPTK